MSKSLRVLIADDESIIRMGLRTILTELGHTVYSAADGIEAVTLAQREQPDLALLDIRMPFRDGLEVASEILKQRPIPIIILTAYSETALLERATAIPVQGYLVKPVKRDDLVSMMHVAIATFNQQRALAERVDELEEKLTARKLIERAKGILMKNGMGEEEAYLHIQHTARSRRTTMSKIAQEILDRAGK
ncbi:MAG: response regulator [Anaerolineae bacterium]|nr:response regulator [Thermoflexales bacterium]MDW8395294.1 response regulator [Anaerolineae bacterium]